MNNETQRGYLVLADISGCTSYLVETELTHACDVLTELLELIVQRFKPLLNISKLEGDAVFAHIPKTKIQRGLVNVSMFIAEIMPPQASQPGAVFLVQQKPDRFFGREACQVFALITYTLSTSNYSSPQKLN